MFLLTLTVGMVNNLGLTKCLQWPCCAHFQQTFPGTCVYIHA